MCFRVHGTMAASLRTRLFERAVGEIFIQPTCSSLGVDTLHMCSADRKLDAVGLPGERPGHRAVFTRALSCSGFCYILFHFILL